MENRNVSPEAPRDYSQQVSAEEFVPEQSLSTENLHQLIEFFRLLDRWERELMHNDSDRDEVTVCSVQ